MNERGTVRLPEYHHTVKKQLIYYTLNCTVYSLTYPEVIQVCVHLSLCLISGFRRQGVYSGQSKGRGATQMESVP